MSPQTLENAFDLFKRFTKSEQDALELIKLFKTEVEEEVSRAVNSKVETLASKQDIKELESRLSVEIKEVETRLPIEMKELEIRLLDRIADMNEKIMKVESNLSWKLLLFWIAQAGFVIALVKYVLIA
jgi:hypothetical protein